MIEWENESLPLLLIFFTNLAGSTSEAFVNAFLENATLIKVDNYDQAVALPANDPLFLNLVQNYLNSLQLLGTLELLQKKWFEDGGWLVQVE